MNSVVAFRANAVGNYSPTTKQRTEAQQGVTANFRALIDGLVRLQAQRQGQNVESSGVAGSQSAAVASTSSQATAGASSANAASSTAKSANSNSELDRDAFLQLLVQQLTHQDPLEPMDNTQMVSQLAEFSALEQMENISSGMGDLAGQVDFLNGNVDQLNFISAQGLIGKFVEGVLPDGSLHSGNVDSVHLEGSIVVLSVDGVPMSMTGIFGIANESTTP